MAARRSDQALDASDAFVHAAVRAFATRGTCPPPPPGSGWVERAGTAGVLAPVVAAAHAAGHVLPAGLATGSVAVAARHLRTMQDLRIVAGLLDAAEVPWAVMKGPALRSVVFADPGVRDYADLDLLVSPRDIRRAIEVLVGQGCTLGPVDWQAAVASRTAELTVLLPYGTHLDLHWGLINVGRVRGGYRLDAETFLSRRTLRRMDGVDVMTLDDEDLALHTMLHACISGASTLRWLLDVQQCVRWLERSSSRDRFAARARRVGLSAPVRAVVSAAARHVDPGIETWRSAGGRRTTWTALLDRVSQRRPPSAPSRTRSSPRNFFAATRSSTPRSLAALALHAVKHVRYARSGWPVVHPRPTSLGDPGLEAWLRLAEADGQR